MIASIPFPTETAALVYRRVRPGAFAVLFALATLTGSVALADQGKWTQWKDWSGGNGGKYAVHMILLPGDGNPYHSRILWFNGQPGSLFYGGEWGWRSGITGCDPIPCDSFPSACFVDLNVGAPGMNVFCSGHSALGDGRVLLPGGTHPATGLYGENKSRLFTRGSDSTAGSWSDPGLMGDWRWYPSATTLRDGRVLVTGGLRHRHHRIFGGFKNGAAPTSPSGDTLYRFAPVVDGLWDPAVLPDSDAAAPAGNRRPFPRAGHSALQMEAVPEFGAHVYFGGRKSDGVAVSDTWFMTREDNRAGPDYKYKWIWPNPTSPPPPRSDHGAVAALNNMMVIYGGLDQNGGTPLADVRRLYKPGITHQWQQMTVSGATPGARCGHTAVYDETIRQPDTLRRMIVYGGTSVPGQPPADGESKVWELRFNPTSPNNATWYEMPRIDLGSAGGPKPWPRYWQAMVMDPTQRTLTLIGQPTRQGHVAFMYGGALGNNAYSDTLWALWVFGDSVAWQHRPFQAWTTPPGKRARHSAVLDLSQLAGRLYVYGGENASGPADRYVYVVDPWAGNPLWYQWDDCDYSLSGHTTVLERSETLSRIPDIWNSSPPPLGQWQAYPSSPLHWRLTYPLNFVVPRGPSSETTRVITVGQDPEAYWLDVPAAGQSPGAWQKLPNGNSGFAARSGVTYRPGRIMIAGGSIGGSGPAVGTTKTLDATSTSNSWVPSANTMVPRDFHNLVLLPDGKVLAVGGTQTASNQDLSKPVRRPQLWDPDAGGGVGAWDDTVLASQPTVRNYHSTAILLPDGRVLSAGGDYQPHQYLANIFCPPYLFKSDGVTLAPRRVIGDAAASFTWGKTFTVCVPDTTGMRRVCLIRPGVTTHGFDENQRHVPLTFTTASDPSRLLVNTPASADSAPPGYYLLFLTGSKEGPTVFPDVPSIARWVRLGNPAGRDTCDSVRPGKITTLAPEVVSQNQIEFMWTATDDDSLIVASGPSQEYDFRYYISPINNETAWGNAWPTSGEPTPAPMGTVQGHTVSSLACCTWYHFAIRSKDDNANPLSPIHNEVKVKTLCIGCSGLRTGPGGEAETMRLASNSAGAASSAPAPQVMGAPTAGGLVVETQRTPGGAGG